MKNILIGAFALLMAACGQVPEGSRGVWLHYGAVEGPVAEPGMHSYNAWAYDLELVDVSSQPYDGRTIAFTRDMQQATISYRVTFRLRPDAVTRVRSQWTSQWSDRLIPPAVPRVIKDHFGLVNASDAVAQRPALQQRMFAALQSRFQPMGIEIDTFDITNIDYSDAFEASVERAQVATQDAVAARNQTAVVQEEARQTGIRATAEANRIQIEAAAITSNPAIIEMRRVEKWNGQYCPQGSQTCIIGGNAPGMMLNVGGR